MCAKSMMKVRVIERLDLSPDIMTLTLAQTNNCALPMFEAGAHIDVQVNDEITRQYSLCNAPGSNQVYRLGILRDKESRGGSQHLHDAIATGSELTVSAPKNKFPLRPEAAHSVLIGGGIGVTPMISMAYQLHSEGHTFQLHYCVTGPSAAAFAKELQEAPFKESVHIHYDMSDAAPAFDPDADIPPADPATHLYTCGPSGFMDWILDAARTKGYAAENLHKEDFGADVDLSGQAFVVEARGSGISVTVSEDQTIAQALSDAGVLVDVSCEEGICGACLTDVLEGEVDHRDIFLTDEEKQDGNLMTICCSRAITQKLVLDI